MSDRAPFADVHTHVAPDVDDGAPDLEHALHYLGIDVERGLRRVVATPHLPASWAGASYRRTAEDAFVELREHAERELPGLEMTLSFEIRLDGAPVDPEDQGLWLGPGRHVLVEYDYFRVPSDPVAPIRPLLDDGLRPVLVHPERYHGWERGAGWIDEVRAAGVLLCPNAGSFVGTHGERASRAARSLLASGAVDLVASDQHARPERCESVADLAGMLFDVGAEEAARRLLWENPVALLEGEQTAPPPVVELAATGSEHDPRRAAGGA